MTERVIYTTRLTEIKFKNCLKGESSHEICIISSVGNKFRSGCDFIVTASIQALQRRKLFRAAESFSRGVV